MRRDILGFAFHTPKSPKPSNPEFPIHSDNERLALCYRPACDSNNPRVTWGGRQLRNWGAGAKSTHARTAQYDGLETPDQARQVTAGHGAESADRRHEEIAARLFPVQYHRNARPAWCGCVAAASQSRTKFNFQAGVGFEFFDNLVVAHHHILDSIAPAFRSKLAQLVEVQGHELFNLKNVDAIAYAGILC